jgi:hypothetical protein
MTRDPDEIEPDEDLDEEVEPEPEPEKHTKKLDVIFIPPGTIIEHTY